MKSIHGSPVNIRRMCLTFTALVRRLHPLVPPRGQAEVADRVGRSASWEVPVLAMSADPLTVGRGWSQGTWAVSALDLPHHEVVSFLKFLSFHFC